MAGEWRVTTLGEFVRLQRGHDLTAEERVPGNFPVMGSAGQNGTHGKFISRGPGVVIGRSGASMGRVHYVPIDYWPHNTCLYVTDFLGNDPRFTFYFLGALDLASYNSGSAQPSLNRNFVYTKPITIPSPKEQRAIAHILGTLDDKIDLNRRRNQTLEAMARALFKDWFIDFGPVRAKMEGRAPYLPADLWQLFPDRLDDEGKPEGWEYPDFDELVIAKQGKYLPKNDMRDFASEGYQVPVWGGNGVLGYSNKSSYKSPVVLMTCRGSNCGLIKHTESEAWISNNSFACIPKLGSVWFLLTYFRAESFDDCISGSAQPQITYTALKTKKMKHPVNEDICTGFSRLVEATFDAILQNNNDDHVLIQLRDTMLPKLISGELRIADTEKFLGDVV